MLIFTQNLQPHASPPTPPPVVVPPTPTLTINDYASKRTTYSFKSSGTTQAATKANALATTPIAIGIITPLQLGTSDLLATTTDLGTAMADNLRNLVQTNWGERLGLYAYGANLKPLLSDIVSQDDFDSQAIIRIKNAVQRWMSYVDLEDFTSTIDHTGKLTSGIAQVSIVITYNIPSLNVKQKKLKVTLYAI
jgi:phage baseplate assembly protein W